MRTEYCYDEQQIEALGHIGALIKKHKMFSVYYEAKTFDKDLEICDGVYTTTSIVIEED